MNQVAPGPGGGGYVPPVGPAQAAVWVGGAVVGAGGVAVVAWWPWAWRPACTPACTLVSMAAMFAFIVVCTTLLINELRAARPPAPDATVVVVVVAVTVAGVVVISIS